MTNSNSSPFAVECSNCHGDGSVYGNEYPCGRDCCGYESVPCVRCVSTGQIKLTVLHDDHGITPEIKELICNKAPDEKGFFIRVIELPEGIKLPCDLYGPSEGDAPIGEDEVHYKTRGERTNLSRLVKKPVRYGGYCIAIGAKQDDGNILLYTAYGSIRGSVSEREVTEALWASLFFTDPFLSPEALETSTKFWAEHALVDKEL
jgi:hypothetical protein